MPIAYTDLSISLARAKERTGGYATDTDNELLTDLLQMSSAVDGEGRCGTSPSPGATHFRPYLVAALFLEQSPQVQTLKEADGVKFSQLATTIASLRSLQAAYDSAQDLMIPPGFEAITKSANKRSPVFTSSSIPVKVIY